MEGLIIVGIAILAFPSIMMIILLVMQRNMRKAISEHQKNLNRLWWQLNDVNKKFDRLIENTFGKEETPEPPPVPKVEKETVDIFENIVPEPPKIKEMAVSAVKPVIKTEPVVQSPVKLDKEPVKTEKKPLQTPEPQNGFESKAAEIIKKAIQWFVVGDDYRSKNVSKEYAVATTWLIRGAIFIILIGFAFFLKYSIEKDLIPPYLRVALTACAGLGMLIAGLVMANKKYHKIAMGFLGGGIAVLYFSIFAAYGIYHLIGAKPAYALMILITLTAGVLAVKMNSLLAAIFGIVGGYATPVLLHTGQVNLAGLYSYILLLGLGALFVARYKNWRSLNFMSFFFTYLLFMLALGKAYHAEVDFAVTIVFLTAYFILFSGLSIFYNLIHKEKIIVFELIIMLINLSVYLAIGLRLIENKFGELDYGAILTIGTAVFYIAQILMFLKLKIKDRNLLLILFTFAAFSITITLPILLSGEYLVCAWAAQAFLFFWLSFKIQSEFLRKLSYVLYGLCLWHLGVVDMHNYFVKASPDYLDGLISRFLSMGMISLSTIGAFLVLKVETKHTLASKITISAENDLKRTKTPKAAAFFWISFVLIFVFLHYESYYFGQAFYKALYLPLQTYIWLGAIAFCSWKLIEVKKSAYSKLLIFLLAGLVLKLVFVDIRFWDINHHLIYGGALDAVAMLIRVAGIIPLMVVLLFFRHKFREEKFEDIVTLKNLYAAIALCILFVYLTFELNFILHHLQPSFRQGGISILWGIFALAMVFRGIRKDVKVLRISGLALFIIIAVKIFLIDLSKQSALVRTSVFIVLGLVMLAGAFLYIKFKETFEKQGESK